MKRFAVLLVVMIAAVGMCAAAVNAEAAVMPIQPKQFFQGLVNSQPVSSVISVVGCPTAASTATGGTGHPLAGQSVSARQLFVPAATQSTGYTGKAHAMNVALYVSPNPMLPLIEVIQLGKLKDYGNTLPISPSLTLPCHGTAQAVFTPLHGGKHASASTVQVTFVSPSIVPSQSSGLIPGQVVSLTGSGFDPATTYTVKECGDLSWAVPLDPCALTNPTTVTTDASGGFTTPFTVAICPLPSTISIAASCYVGVALPSGVDTIGLVGAAKIEVMPLPPAAS